MPRRGSKAQKERFQRVWRNRLSRSATPAASPPSRDAPLHVVLATRIAALIARSDPRLQLVKCLLRHVANIGIFLPLGPGKRFPRPPLPTVRSKGEEFFARKSRT